MKRAYALADLVAQGGGGGGMKRDSGSNPGSRPPSTSRDQLGFVNGSLDRYLGQGNNSPGLSNGGVKRPAEDQPGQQQRKVAATDLMMGVNGLGVHQLGVRGLQGLNAGLVTNPNRANIEAHTEKVKQALVRGNSFDNTKNNLPGVLCFQAKVILVDILIRLIPLSKAVTFIHPFLLINLCSL